MLGVIVNTLSIVAGSLLGLLFARWIKERFTSAIVAGLGLCTALIGVQNAVKTENVLCVVACVVVGVLIGEALDIDKRIEGFGEWLRKRVEGGGSAKGRFTEAFVTASLVMCVGSMAVMGSISAGVSQDYSILYAKSALDMVFSVALAAGMGVGVLFSALPVLLCEGVITLLALELGGLLTAQVVTEMSAVGGVLLMGTAINTLGLRKDGIKVANMLPAIFLPMAYLPFSSWLSGVLG